MEPTQKPCLSVVFAGHVDTGKSTLFGHTSYLLGCENERKMDKLRQESRDMGKSSFCYAWITDTERSERERGITISGKCKQLEAPNYKITVWDAPGHRDFIKNTLTCVAQSDVMVLCVASEDHEFDYSISESGAVKNLLITSLCLGIKQVIVVVNKMDSVGYSGERFAEIEQKLSKVMVKVGWKTGSFSFIPVSAWHGDNIIVASNKMPWWNGLTFSQALFTLSIPERLNDHPLRFVVNDSYRIPGIGIVITGRVSSGTIKPTQVITFGTSNSSPITVHSIEQHHQMLTHASSGMGIGMNIKAMQMTYRDFERGMVAGDASNHPPTFCSSFSAEVYIVNHPGKLIVGYTPIIDCGTAHVACRMSSITCLLSKTKEVLEEPPKFLKKGNFARVVFVPKKPMVVEEYSKFPDVLGRIIIRDGPMIVGVGKVVGVDTKEENKSVGILTKAAIRKD